MWLGYGSIIFVKDSAYAIDNSYTFLSVIMSQNCTYIISNAHDRSERRIYRGESKIQAG